MVSKKDSNKQRLKRHKRVRAKISGTESRPRLSVYRSLNNIRAQVIDDVNGVTVSPKSFSTEADTFTTVVYWSLRKAQEKADLSSKSCKPGTLVPALRPVYTRFE